MAESKNDLTENKKKRPNKLTNARIKKEIEFLEKMFVGVDDENKKTLINSLIEEAAFLKVACFQAKEELKKEGLTTEICKSPPLNPNLREIFTPIYRNYPLTH